MIEFKILDLLAKREGERQSWRKLAKEIGVSHMALFLMAVNGSRNGKRYNPSLETLEKLCEYFKCQPGDLLRYKKETKEMKAIRKKLSKKHA